MALLPGYLFRGGVHPPTAGLANALAHAGVTTDATAEPLTEAQILGIAGGLGAGYILWQFKSHSSASLVMAFRANWQYAHKLLDAVGGHVGGLVVHQTGGAKGAAKALDEALDAGRAALIQVDPYHLPYAGLPEHLDGCGSRWVTVCGRADGGGLLIDDLGSAPWTLSTDEVATARGRIGSYKHRLVTVDPQATARPLDLKAAMRWGLAHCAEHLSTKSDSFGLPAFRKWARLLTDTKHKKAWANVFSEPIGLYSSLKCIYEGIRHNGTDGSGLRGLYSEYLRSAARILELGDLEGVADRYDEAGAAWIAVADAALPPDVAEFQQARQLMADAWTARQLGQDGGPALKAATGGLEEMRRQLDPAPPIADRTGHYASLAAAVSAAYEAELVARDALIAAI